MIQLSILNELNFKKTVQIQYDFQIFRLKLTICPSKNINDDQKTGNDLSL